MIEALLGLALRHGLTLLGGYLMSKGGLDATSVATITGAITSVAGIAMSALNKVKVVAKLDAATNSFANLNK